MLSSRDLVANRLLPYLPIQWGVMPKKLGVCFAADVLALFCSGGYRNGGALPSKYLSSVHVNRHIFVMRHPGRSYKLHNFLLSDFHRNSIFPRFSHLRYWALPVLLTRRRWLSTDWPTRCLGSAAELRRGSWWRLWQSRLPITRVAERAKERILAPGPEWNQRRRCCSEGRRNFRSAMDFVIPVPFPSNCHFPLQLPLSPKLPM